MSSVAQNGVEREAGAASSPKGGVSSITPPSNSQGLSTGGEDTAVIGLGVLWGENWEPLLEKLEAAKKDAQENGMNTPLQWGDIQFSMRPNGYNAGGGKGSFHAYVLEHQGITISLVRLIAPKESTPNVRVNIGSLPLMELGRLEPCYELARNLVEALGGTIQWSKLSRVDVCVDLPGVHVHEFLNPILAGQTVCRGRKWGIYGEGDEGTGYTRGTKHIVLRIYDKLREVKGNPRKYEILKAGRWGGVPPTATRVEFQIRRAALKNRFGVDSVEDYLAKRPLITHYLCTEWARLCEGPVDKTHTTRAMVHPIWEKVCNAFEAWTGSAVGELQRVRYRQVDPVNLFRQAAGCLVSSYAQKGTGIVLGKESFLHYASEMFDSFLNDGYLRGSFEQKNLRWIASGPVHSAKKRRT